MNELKTLANQFQLPHLPNGFLPTSPVLTQVNRPELSSFNELMNDLPYYFPDRMAKIKNNQFPPPQLNVDEFSNEEKLTLARDVAFIVQAWHHGNHRLKHILPVDIALPALKLLTAFAGVPPCCSYYFYALHNFIVVDPECFKDLNNIRVIRLFYNKTPDEEWFIRIHVAIELIAAPIISHHIPQAIQHAAEPDWKALETDLQIIGNLIWDMVQMFKKIGLSCHPDIYYKFVRPQIMPIKGLIFEKCCSEKPFSFEAGETGAQTPTIPALDAFLGITHQPTDGFNFVKSMRGFMLPGDRQYISALEARPQSMREIVLESQQGFLRGAFNHAVSAMAQFRRLHLKFAKDYIFSKPTPQIGTGGTPAKWLQQLIEETEAALIDEGVAS